MLGLGTIIASIDSAQIYKEADEIDVLGALDVWFDFSTLTGDQDDEVSAVTNLGLAGGDHDIDEEDATWSMVTNLSCPKCACHVDVYYPKEDNVGEE